MDFLGGSAADPHGENRARLEDDSRPGRHWGCLSDFPAESHRGPNRESRRDSQGDMQEDCRGDSGGALWAQFEGDNSVSGVERTGVCGVGMPDVPRSSAVWSRSAKFRAGHDAPLLLSLSFFLSGNDFPCLDHFYLLHSMRLGVYSRRSAVRPESRAPFLRGRSAAGCTAF